MRRLVVLLLSLCTIGALAEPVRAAEPPNQHDPCSRAGRDSCGTTGVGRYATYRYGLRWFGDYRKAVPSEDDPTFCIDLRFWYPSSKFAYRQRSTDGLKNREGQRISGTRLAYMNYALWKYGRSNQVTRQAAVMLYVHHLMDDGAPGEIDPGAISPQIESMFNRISSEAKRYAGPYRVVASLPSGMTVGTAATMNLRVLSASGNAVPGVSIHLDARGAPGLPAETRTGSDGTVDVAFTPGSAGEVAVTATANGLAAETPKLYAPTRGEAKRSGQRLVSAAGTARSTQAQAAAAPAQIQVSTTATPATLGAGGQSTDAIKISGAPAGWSATVESRLYGPFPTRAAITCTGTPAATTTLTAGPGDTKTPPVTLTTPGWYGYQLTVPSTADVLGTVTPCVPDEETVHVQTQPVVVTQVSSAALAPGDELFDRVKVTGLAGQTVTVNVALFGPYPAPDAMTCQGAPAWTGSFTADHDGDDYTTDKVKLTVPGYYTYRESIAATDQVNAVETPCAEASETTVVTGAPRITTQVSAATTAPGSQLSDTAVVSGLGALKAEVGVELWGPFASPAEIRCEGTPFWTGTFTAGGDGTYQTEPVTLTKAGYYTYRERIFPTGAYAGVQTACGEAAETTFTQSTPVVKTTVSDAVVGQKTSIADHLVVSGMGETPATVKVELFGPFATRAEIRCTGTPFWTGTVDVTGDGEYDTDEVTLNRAGFYTFRESIDGSAAVAATQTACAEEAETALAAPLIQTGRTAPVARRSIEPEDDARAAAGLRPTRVQLSRLGISATVSSSGIDTKTGELAVPKDITRTGWWKDGAAPGSEAGATLIAGHVDSAKRGAGAFYRLKDAKRGDRVMVTTVDGKVRTYRVTSVRTVRKNRLPQSLFTRTGERRLFLVTCGGPFNPAIGHYRDNVVLTAVPA